MAGERCVAVDIGGERCVLSATHPPPCSAADEEGNRFEWNVPPPTPTERERELLGMVEGLKADLKTMVTTGEELKKTNGELQTRLAMCHKTFRALCLTLDVAGWRFE